MPLAVLIVSILSLGLMFTFPYISFVISIITLILAIKGIKKAKVLSVISVILSSAVIVRVLAVLCLTIYAVCVIK